MAFKLVDGKCEINYSFKAEYWTPKDNELIKIHRISYDCIREMIIDDMKIIEQEKFVNKYTFPKAGKHTAYLLTQSIRENDISNAFLYDICFIHK